mgnify:CR=1 FL=1
MHANADENPRNRRTYPAQGKTDLRKLRLTVRKAVCFHIVQPFILINTTAILPYILRAAPENICKKRECYILAYGKKEKVLGVILLRNLQRVKAQIDEIETKERGRP